MGSIFVNKTEFTNYMACSYTTASKKYDFYLSLAGKAEGQELTIYDLSRLDDIDLEIVKKRCGKS